MSDKQIDDLTLCFLYQYLKKDKYFNQMKKRYQASINRQAYKIFNSVPKHRLGLEKEDIHNGVLMCLSRAMKYVNIDKIDVNKFRFNVIFQYMCKSYRESLVAKDNANKRSKLRITYLDDTDIYDTYFQHDSTFKKVLYSDLQNKFENTLTNAEKLVFFDIQRGVPNKKIKEHLEAQNHCISVWRHKRSLRAKYKKIAAQY